MIFDEFRNHNRSYSNISRKVAKGVLAHQSGKRGFFFYVRGAKLAKSNIKGKDKGPPSCQIPYRFEKVSQRKGINVLKLPS